MRKQYHARVVNGDTHIWDVHRLVDLASSLPVALVPLESLRELDENWWYSDPAATPTPRSLAAHIDMVRRTNIEHPIILCAEGRLMDGMHRSVKALLEGHDAVRAVRFPETPEPDYINVSLNDLPYDDA